MTSFITYTVFGIVIGSAYAIAASGLVLTYATSRIFNMAHGAIGMVMAFVYWELLEHLGLPIWLSLFLVILVIAPLCGALIQRVAMQRLADAPVSVSLVITVGLMVLMIGAAQAIWPPSNRSVPPLFAGHGVTIGDAFVSANGLVAVALAVVVAASLYLFLNRTRTGIAMRAVVDNPDLVALHGARPELLAALSWAGGASLAALGGIVLAPDIGLDYFQLTLLVISAYAAAMLGKLKSLPLTFLGAIGLGLAQSYVVGFKTYLPAVVRDLDGLEPAVPVLFLFAVLLFLPHAQLRVGQVKGIRAVAVPSLRTTLVGSVAFVAVAVFLSRQLSTADTNNLAEGLTFSIVMLSLVLLTGYGGYVSLAQFSFAGIGALVVARMESGSVLALLAGGAVAALVGGLIALPLLRLRGLYLALGTFAFAQFMDKLILQADFAFKQNGSLPVQRLAVGGLKLDDEQAYLVGIAVVVALTAIGVLALRRGRFGRLLIAMRDSPAACGTLGLDLTRARVLVFAMSAGIAGIAGGLLGGLKESIGGPDVDSFRSLLLILLVVVCGVTSATGAIAGGIILMLLPIIQSKVPELNGLVFLVIGGGAVALGRNPNGLAALAFNVGRHLRALLPSRERPQAPAGGAPVDEDLLTSSHVEVLSGAS